MKNHRSTKAFIWAIICSLLIIFSFINRYPVDVDKKLQKTVSEVNKLCPFIIDDAQLQLDSIILLPGRKLQIYAKFINISLEVLDDEKLKLFIEGLEPALIQDIKDGDDALLRDNDVTFLYNFWDKAGGYICFIEITPEKYK